MPRFAAAAVALLVGLCVALQGPLVHAQDVKAKRTARKLLTAGDRALQAGERLARRPNRREQANAKFQAALDSYNRAYEAYPQPQIYFAIGNAEEKLGRYLDAHGHYRRLLEEAEKPSDQLKNAVEARIEAVLGKLTVVTFVAKPKGATIFLDEQEIGTAPLAEPLILEPGPHRISVRKEGHSPGADQFVAEPGGKLERKVVLKLIPRVEDEIKAAPPPPPPTELGPPPGRWILLGSLIGTGLLASGATGWGIASVTQHGIFTDTAQSNAERENARDKGQRYALTSDILLGGTIVAAGWTAFYYYAIYRPRAATWESDARARAEREAWLTPYATDGGGGLAVGGRF